MPWQIVNEIQETSVSLPHISTLLCCITVTCIFVFNTHLIVDFWMNQMYFMYHCFLQYLSMVAGI